MSGYHASYGHLGDKGWTQEREDIPVSARFQVVQIVADRERSKYRYGYGYRPSDRPTLRLSQYRGELIMSVYYLGLPILAHGLEVGPARKVVGDRIGIQNECRYVYLILLCSGEKSRGRNLPRWQLFRAQKGQSCPGQCSWPARKHVRLDCQTNPLKHFA